MSGDTTTLREFKAKYKSVWIEDCGQDAEEPPGFSVFRALPCKKS